MRIGQTLYLDHQATTPLDPQVREAMQPFFGDVFGNPHSSEHIVGWQAAEAVEIAASQVAALLGADSDEVIFTAGATEANNLAVLGTAFCAPPERRRILVSAVEHKSVLAAAAALRQHHGWEFTTIPVDRAGSVDLEVLENNIDTDVRLVSVMAVNNEIGTIQNVRAVSEIVRRAQALFHCDATQAPCALDARALADCADLISISAHKIYGPKGIGALYVRRNLQHEIVPLIHGGGQQNGLRSGTLSPALCVGFGRAADLAAGPDAEAERSRVAYLRDRFVSALQRDVWAVVQNCPQDRCHPGCAPLLFDGLSAQDLLSVLQPAVAASSGSACSSGQIEPSHVLRAIGLTPDQAEASVRFSIGRFTTETDIDEAAAAIRRSIGKIGRRPKLSI